MKHLAALTALLVAVTGCVKQNTPTTVDPLTDPMVDYRSIPRLPSPYSGTYDRNVSPSPDEVVGYLTAQHNWETNLSGAAANIALTAVAGEGSLTRWELRESLWMAGYPYPIKEARVWSSSNGTPPPAALIRWLERWTPEQDLGLVRARARNGDAWVGIVAQPRVDLGSLPREARVSDPVRLPPIPGGSYRAADANGVLHTGPLDEGATLLLTIAGEWLFEVSDSQGVVATFPVYAGVAAPKEALLRLKETLSVGSASDASDLGSQLLAHVRTEFGLLPFSRNPLVDAAVRTHLRGDQRPMDELLAGVGLTVENTVIWRCSAGSVEDCVDQWVWSPEKRELLLSKNVDAMGLGAQLDTTGVEMLALFVRNPGP